MLQTSKRSRLARQFANCRACASLMEGPLAGNEKLADVKLPNGSIRKAELHWYEASGIGKKEFKIQRFVV